MKTESEILFENYCAAKKIFCNKIPETNIKTADYCLNNEN